MLRKFSILLVSILVFSCTSNKGPEDVLRSFVDHRFNKDLTKEDISDYFAGSLLQEYDNLDEQVLGYINQVKALKKRNFKINFKRCEADKCFITYTLSYEDEKNVQVLVKVKKIAELAKIENSWKITGITEVKSHYDFKTIGN